MNVIDLFAGCGGLSYGFQKAGFNILLGVDKNEKVKKTFVNNHKNSKFLVKDIKDVDKSEIEKLIGDKKIDILIGGPPCQGFSVAGNRVEFDSRNSLYKEFFRIVDYFNPKAILIENVPGLKNLYGGRALKRIKSEFIKQNYIVNDKILKADNYGVPQIRRRIFIVGLKDNLFEFPFIENSKITLGEAISDLPLLEDQKENFYYKSEPKNRYQEEMRLNSDKVYNHVATNHEKRTKKIISMVPEGGNYKDLPKKYRDTRNVNIAWTRLDRSKPSLTIDTGHRHIFHPVANRVPTVRECARIQSFPDDFIFYGSKTSQRKQVGNAVPPKLAKRMAIQVKKYLSEEMNVQNTQRILSEDTSYSA